MTDKSNADASITDQLIAEVYADDDEQHDYQDRLSKNGGISRVLPRARKNNSAIPGGGENIIQQE